MSSLVVYESMWGNTKTVAEAVAEGIGRDVAVVHVADAPVLVPSDVDLLVVGGPTHASR
jgi:flavodoxin